MADMNYKSLSVSHSDREIINEDRGDRDKGYLRERKSTSWYWLSIAL